VSGNPTLPPRQPKLICANFVHLAASYNDPVNLRFHIDPVTGEPHIHGHGVSEIEVEEVLTRPHEDRPGKEGSWLALGQTRQGRYLRVIYVPDPTRGSIFVVTAYDLGPKARRALGRRVRKKK
jgi:hypothetical protein